MGNKNFTNKKVKSEGVIQTNSLLRYILIKTDENLLLATIFIAYLWCLSFGLNSLIVGVSFMSWIFIPSGIKLILFMIYRQKAFLGIVLGSYFINILSHHMIQSTAIIVSLLCALSPLLALLIFEYVKGFQILSKRIAWSDVVMLGILFSVINAISHGYFFSVSGLVKIGVIEPIKMAVGDFTGLLLVVGITIQVRKRIYFNNI